MDPIAFTIFGLNVAWYGIIITIGLLIGILLATNRSKAEGLYKDVIIDMSLVVVPSAVIGARLYYVLFNLDKYLDNPSHILHVHHGGLAIHGALIVGGVAAYLFCRHKKISFWKLADICAPSIILGQAIGRWGNFINQEAYGVPTTLPWAIEVNGSMVHPTFLYESLWNIVVFAILIYFSKKKQYPGQVFLMYLTLYSVGRFFVEGLRIDSLMIGSLRMAQVISILIVIISMLLMKMLRNRNILIYSKIN